MKRSFVITIFLIAAGLAVSHAAAMENVSLLRDGREHHIAGKVLVESQDGGLLLLSPGGVLWAVQPEEIVRRRSDPLPFRPLDREELKEQLLAELPEGFQTHDTAHYVICYNTSRAYAHWCGALYERLYRAFINYWTHRGFELHDPESPLPAIIFADKPTYARYAQADLGEGAEAVIGYYNMRTNRVVMYDLTGVENAGLGRAASSAAHINRVLSRPQAERTVATIIHEATHQIAFNCGLQARYADIPLWVSEGIAVYFETPDLQSSKGWRKIGDVNRERLFQFRQYLRARPADSLKTLVAGSRRFHNPQTAPDAYAEAWALNYYLLRRRFDDYRGYLEMLAAKKPLIHDTEEDRLAAFQAAFGADWETLDREFVEYMRDVR
ncbi:MAG: DUF1570 domain-containing protein [Planctomycetes bacterium]|nr:DUF1570 domain-containing protein [Planctomycetota bacterium]